MNLVTDTIARITPLDDTAVQAACMRLTQLTKQAAWAGWKIWLFELRASAARCVAAL